MRVLFWSWLNACGTIVCSEITPKKGKKEKRRGGGEGSQCIGFLRENFRLARSIFL